MGPTCDDGRMPARHRKQSAAAPPGYFAWEAAGLRWLARRGRGAAVVEVLDEGAAHLDLSLLTPGATDPRRSRAAGSWARGDARGRRHGARLRPTRLARRRLARPAQRAVAAGAGRLARVGDVLRAGAPHARCSRSLDSAGRSTRPRSPCSSASPTRVAAGAFDTGEPPSRLHGDLWSGNVLWTADDGGAHRPGGARWPPRGRPRDAGTVRGTAPRAGARRLRRGRTTGRRVARTGAVAPGAPAAAARRALRRLVRGAGACARRGATSERAARGRGSTAGGIARLPGGEAALHE